MTYSPEIELILCCARTQTNTEVIQKINELTRKSLNWDTILDIAYRQGVLPLLYWQLKLACSAVVPSDVWVELKDYYNRNSRKNFVITGELLRLNHLFEVNHIPMLSVKGPTLAQLAYGQSALRDFTDLDILVPSNFYPLARQLLTQQGYKPRHVLSDYLEHFYMSQFYEMMFWNDEKQITVDLHWSLIARQFSFSANDSSVWNNTESVNFLEQKVLTLSRENLILFLCAHASKHGWLQLKWICDIAELLKDESQINWDHILSSKKILGTQNMLFIGLILSSDLLNLKIPEYVSKQIGSDSKIIEIADKIKSTIFSVDENKNFQQTSMYLQTIDSPIDKLNIILNYFRPCLTDLSVINLPSNLVFLYFLVRPTRLLFKYSYIIFDRVFKK